MDNKDKNVYSLSLDIDFSSEQKISDLISKYSVRVLYLGENRNGSYFTKEVVDGMLETLGGIPVIGHYDAEKGDFLSHGDLRVMVTETGDVETKKVGPVPYGFIPLNPRTWWEKHLDKDSVEREYLCTEAYLWTGRYDELSILKENKNNQSMELNPKTSVGQWTDIDGGYWYVFTKAEFNGLCILGQDVEPCFEGAGFTSNFALDDSFAEKLAAMKEELQFALNDYEDAPEVEEPTEEPEEVVEEPEVTEEPQEEVEEPSEPEQKEFQEDEDEEEELEPTQEELEQIEKEEKELDPKDLEIDSSIDSVEVDDYKKLQEKYESLKELYNFMEIELSQKTSENNILNNENKKLKAELEKANSELAEYKNKELEKQKFELLDKYSSYISEEKLNEIKQNINNYSLEELDALAVTTAFEYMKEIMNSTRPTVTTKTDFTIVDEEKELPKYEEGSWQAEVLKKQKEMQQGG